MSDTARTPRGPDKQPRKRREDKQRSSPGRPPGGEEPRTLVRSGRVSASVAAWLDATFGSTGEALETLAREKMPKD